MSANTRILGTPRGVDAIAHEPVVDGCLPESIAGYTVLQAIGQGGMGNVYEVRHNTLDKSFALKLISESLRDNAEAVDRFRSETLALGKLEHPNIVMAIDAGVWQGRPFLVTELLKGQDLASRVTECGKMDVESVISIATQVADALSFAHEHGYYHRDIKPSNIFYQPDGKAKLLDFGLVRSESNNSRTQAGCLMGTVDFVAPEQACNAAQAGVASDIYSLGCTLVYLLSGEVPFPDSRYPSLTAKLKAHLHETPEWLAQAHDECPRWLIDLICALVAKKPSDRPAGCQLIKSSLLSRTFPANQPSASSPLVTVKSRSSTGLKLALGSGMAIAISGIAWTLVGIDQSPNGFSTTPRASSPASDSEATNALQSKDPDPFTESQHIDSPAENRVDEKTLPVSVTHNARGARLPGKEFGKELGKNTAETSLFLSKDASHE